MNGVILYINIIEHPLIIEQPLLSHKIHHCLVFRVTHIYFPLNLTVSLLSHHRIQENLLTLPVLFHIHRTGTLFFPVIDDLLIWDVDLHCSSGHTEGSGNIIRLIPLLLQLHDISMER